MYGRGGYGYRRGYGGGYRRRGGGSGGGRVRRELKTSLAAAAVDTLYTVTVAIPVDSTRNIGINVHEFTVERGVAATTGGNEPTGTITDVDWSAAWLNRNTPSTERMISDVDCIAKIKWGAHKHGTPANAYVDCDENLVQRRFYPPIPIFQDDIRFCIYHHFGTVQTYHMCVAYTLAWMSVGQIVGIAKNIII